MKEIFWKSQGIWSVTFPTDEQLMNCQKWNKIKLHKAFISFHLNSKLCFVIWLTGRWFGRKSNRANVVKSEVTSATHRSGHWCDPNEQNPSKQVQTLEVTPSTEPMLLQSLLSFADVRRKRYDLAQPRKPRFRFNDQLWDHQWYMVNQFILPSVHQSISFDGITFLACSKLIGSVQQICNYSGTSRWLVKTVGFERISFVICSDLIGLSAISHWFHSISWWSIAEIMKRMIEWLRFGFSTTREPRPHFLGLICTCYLSTIWGSRAAGSPSSSSTMDSSSTTPISAEIM